MNRDALNDILAAHARWLNGDGGNRAVLAGMDLSGMDLSGRDLSRSNLSRSNLSRSNLSRSNLAWSNLAWCDLAGSNLAWSDLAGSNLAWSDLAGSNLYRAILKGTVLDPSREPNGDVDGFEHDGEYVIGYRTRAAGHIDQYRDGRIYAADWFSCCPVTECHPGLYLWPTIQLARNWDKGDLIRVRTKPADVHHVGTKWRCRWFEVLGEPR